MADPDQILIDDSIRFLQLFCAVDFGEFPQLIKVNPPGKKNELVSFLNKDLDDLIQKLIFPHLTNNPQNDEIFCPNNPTKTSFFYTLNNFFSQCFEKNEFQKCEQENWISLQNIFRSCLDNKVFDTLDCNNPKHSWILHFILRLLDNIDDAQFKGLKTITEEALSSFIHQTYDSKFYKLGDLIHKDNQIFIEQILHSHAFKEGVINATKKILKSLKKSHAEIKSELDKIILKLWDFLFISTIEPNTFAESYGDKFILFSPSFFNEILVHSSNQKVNDRVMAKFVINLIHEFEHFLIRDICSTINIFQSSPKSTNENDAGVKLEKELFGEKVEYLGYFDTVFLMNIKSWESSLNNFKTNFKKAVKQNKQIKKSQRKMEPFQTYAVGRMKLIKNRCGTNLTAYSYQERMKKYEQDELAEKKPGMEEENFGFEEEKLESKIEEENLEGNEEKLEIKEGKTEGEKDDFEFGEQTFKKQEKRMSQKKRTFEDTGFLRKDKAKKKAKGLEIDEELI